MDNSNEVLKKCSRCDSNSLKSYFYRDRKKKDGYRPLCKIRCQKYYYDNQNRILNNHKNYKKNRSKINAYERQKGKTKFNFNLLCSIRRSTNKALNSQTIKKTSKTIDLIGSSQSFFKRWIFYFFMVE